MAINYISERTGIDHDNDQNRLLVLENQNLNNRVAELENIVLQQALSITSLEQMIANCVTKTEYNFWIPYGLFDGVVAENGAVVTVPSGKNGFFVYGLFGLATLQLLRVAAGTVVTPSNTYWGSDPVPGIGKYMWYKFYS